MSEEEVEEKVINEQYKTWRVNSRLLYDACISHALEWPSLTIEWLPDVTPAAEKGYEEHQVIIGTHTSESEQNYLMLAKIVMPSEGSDVTGGGGKPARVEITQRIPHDGEVNRARHMPQRPSIIATKAPAAEVMIFDCSKHGMKPASGAKCQPDKKLVGHDKEGYGLAWSPHTAGKLLSGSDDTHICLWDIEANHSNAMAIDPITTFKSHTNVVEDVVWHYSRPNCFASVGDDKMLFVWDEREAESPAQQVQAHSAEINCVHFNPFNEHLIATGSADKTVALWDLRNLSSKLHAFDWHSDEVIQVQWSPKVETLLGSCSQDRRICVWDVSRIGDDLPQEDAEDGGPELLFTHGGHTSKVSDFCWSANRPWMVASVAEDNILQVWEMASHIYKDDEDMPDVDMDKVE